MQKKRKKNIKFELYTEFKICADPRHTAIDTQRPNQLDICKMILLKLFA